LATDELRYLTYAEAVLIHIDLMRLMGEKPYGVLERSLIESALARPRHAAAYEAADLVRQAATLCFGLIKNHPWAGGNKRTATAIMRIFLRLNSHKLVARTSEQIEMVLAVESNNWHVSEVEAWLRSRVTSVDR
jgi:death-on-curing protein